MNNLYSVLGGNVPDRNLGNMVNQFRQFASAFRGDPKAQVQELLNTGKMSQEQYNRLASMASQFMQILK